MISAALETVVDALNGLLVGDFHFLDCDFAVDVVYQVFGEWVGFSEAEDAVDGIESA